MEETPANIKARGTMGLGVAVNDDDDLGGRDNQVMWATTTGDLWQRSDVFPAVSLVESLNDPIYVAGQEHDWHPDGGWPAAKRGLCPAGSLRRPGCCSNGMRSPIRAAKTGSTGRREPPNRSCLLSGPATAQLGGSGIRMRRSAMLINIPTKFNLRSMARQQTTPCTTTGEILIPEIGHLSLHRWDRRLHLPGHRHEQERCGRRCRRRSPDQRQ